MVIYSHSRLSSFEQCPLRYNYRYIEKIQTKEKSIEGLLGSLVHETLEWLYYEVKKGHIPTIDETITHFSINWQDQFQEEIHFVVKYQFQAKDYFEKGVIFLLNYYQKNKPFNDNTIALEKRVTIFLDKLEEYQMVGIIDRVVHKPEINEVEIHDYKTANSLPSKEQIETDRQLPLYSMGIKEEFANHKIKLIWHYLAHNKRIYSQRTNEQLQQLRQETIELIKKVENATEFPAEKSVLCGWCEYKGICPVMKSQRALPF